MHLQNCDNDCYLTEILLSYTLTLWQYRAKCYQAYICVKHTILSRSYCFLTISQLLYLEHYAEFRSLFNGTCTNLRTRKVTERSNSNRVRTNYRSHRHIGLNWISLTRPIRPLPFERATSKCVKRYFDENYANFDSHHTRNWD